MVREKLGRLIIVDDEIDTLNPLCDLLSEWGYEVKGLTLGKEALETLKKQDFDLLLADLVMPEMDGIELMKAAMEIAPLIVCIIVTGKGTIQTAVEAMKVGAFDYVLKPIEWKTFKPILSRAMEIRHLKKSEEKYRSIVEDQTEFICRWKPGEILTFVNEPYCRYFNKKQEELLGHSFMTLIPEEDRDKIHKHLASLGPENPVSTHEHQVISPNGEIRWQQWTNRALFDDQGHIAEFQSVGYDITERKRMEESLKKTQEWLRFLVSATPAMLYSCNSSPPYAATFVSENIKVLLDYEPWEFIENPNFWADNIHPEDAPHIFAELLRLFEKGDHALEYRFRRKDGTYTWMHDEMNLLRDENGNPSEIFGYWIDITERKRAEEALKESDKRYRLLFNNVSDAIFVHGVTQNISDIEKFKIIEVNDIASKYLGYTREELLQMNITELDAPETLDNIPTILNKLFTEGRATWEGIHRHKDGHRIPVEISLQLFKLHGKPMVLSSVRDITERKQREEELKKSYRQLRDLAARLSEVEETEKRQIAQELHDQVGQNLTALGINLNIIRSQISKKSAKLADYRLKDSLELLEKTTESIRNVMSDLRPSVLDDYGLLAGIRWYSEKFSVRTNIAVKIHGKDLTLRLPMSVETTMFRITQEALTNIAKHSNAKKTIINLEERDDKVQLSIADDGIGFDPKTVYKMKNEMVWGLHAMKERAEALGGKFFVESKPGKGTTIIVEIKR
jgi:PAS domain S-box-containing protein